MANDLTPLKGVLDDIGRHDPQLALGLAAALGIGDKKTVNADLTKVRAQGLAADANTIAAWVTSTMKDYTKDASSSGSPLDPLKAIPGALTGAVSNAFLGPLFQSHIWIRVLEVGLGVLLIAVGLAKLTNVVPLATKIAKTVSKVPI